jgi:copper homeostasis protein CutC
VKIWINQAGDVVAPPMQQAGIANRIELVQGLAAAGFAAGLGAIGWLTRRSMDRRRQPA